MRSAPIVIFLLLASSLVGGDEAAMWPRPLTVVFSTANPIPEEVFGEMRYEMGRLFRASGLLPEWMPRSEMKAGIDVEFLVVAAFQGDCRMEALAPGRPARGSGAALGFAHATGADVLPFAVIRCDDVRAAVHSAMHGGDFEQGSRLLGRALARVLAHEIFHIISKEHEHSAGGLFKAALSGRDLIAERLDFHPDDIARLRLESPAALPGPAAPRESHATRD